MSLAQKIEKEFGKENYSYLKENHILKLSASRLLSSMDYLKRECGFIMLLDICGVDNSKIKAKPFEVVYHLLNMEIHQRLRVKIELSDCEWLPSVSAIWSGADWFEQECWDMFGISFLETEKARLITHDEFQGHPLRKDFDVLSRQPLNKPRIINFPSQKEGETFQTSSKTWTEIKSSFPNLHGMTRIMVETEDLKVLRAQVEVGFHHRGIEKLSEKKSYQEITNFTNDLNYCSPAMNNIGWCKAIEDAAGIELTDRVKALRMIFAELSRVTDHLICVGTMAAKAGSMNTFWSCLELRELICRLIRAYYSKSSDISLTKIGGMVNDIPKGWRKDCLEIIQLLQKGIFFIHSDLTRSRGWMERSQVGFISAIEALNHGYTGPCLRASGVNYDIRRVSPYYFYDEVDFEVPLGIAGSCYDRYLVRMEEMKQSLRIITQVLENLPIGKVLSEEVNNNEPFRLDKCEFYSSTETANGELGFFIVSDGGVSPYRLKIRPPSFPLMQSYQKIIIGHSIEDAPLILSSLNVVAGELDR